MINDRVFISESILVILRSIRLKVVVRSKIEFFIELCISMFVEILNNFVVHPLPALSGHSGQRSGSGRKRIFALQKLAAKSGGEDTEEFCWTTSNTLRGSPYSSF